MKKQELKARALETVEAHRTKLIGLSLKIHAHPELGFEEIKALEWLTEYLDEEGFRVERGITGLPTAFSAKYGKGNPVVAFLAEYDALPGLGHACGHNIIAAAAVGAGIATKNAVDQVGGQIMVIGTPAEELYGGKVIMLERGGFEGIDATLMIHPGSKDVAAISTLACASLNVEFFGKSVHASANPDQGINALEALLLSFNNINSLRQHTQDESRIHGIITAGGEAANIVPSYSSGTFLVRARDLEYLEQLRERVLDCFVASAIATGARLEHKWGEVTYTSMRNNVKLVELFSSNMEMIGRRCTHLEPGQNVGSTDTGNVSQIVPSIEASVAIVPQEIGGHSPEFALAAASEAGHQGMIDGAKALALTAIDLLADPEAMAELNKLVE